MPDRRNRSRYVPGGITLFLQCAFNPMATASAMLATTFGVRLVGPPSPTPTLADAMCRFPVHGSLSFLCLTRQ